MSDCSVNLRNRGICVLIPTFDNAGTIVDVVTRARSYCDDVFVISDGCTDDTVERLEAMEKKPHLVVLPENTGKGNALREGFRKALECGFSYAITLDADGQHYPEDIPLFLEANRRNPGALIVGSRVGLENVERSKASCFANYFSNFWFFIQTFRPLKDTQTGYRLYPLKKLRGLSLLTSRYEAELELLVFAAWSGIAIATQNVRVHYPPKGERVSHFRPVTDFARIFLLNVVLCVLAVVYGLPRTLLRGMYRFLVTLTVLLAYVLSMVFVVTPYMVIRFGAGGMTDQKKERFHGLICRFAGFALGSLKWAGISYTQVNDVGEDFSRPAIIICNHQSHLDLLPLLSLTPKMIVLTTKWVWYNPLYGFIIRKADYLPVTRGFDAISPRLRELVKEGYSVAVYPEGTRSKDCSIGRFHQGAFHLAAVLGADILPLVLYGTGKALPKHGRILHRWPVRLEVDKRMSPKDLSRMGGTSKEQASYMRKYYISRYSELSDKVEQELK